MKRKLLAACCASALLFTGCAATPPPVPEFAESGWEALLDQQRYRSALLMLEIHELAPEQREALRLEAERRAAQQRRQLIREASRLADAGQFREADALLENAAAEQLNVAELEKARARLERQVTLREQRGLASFYLVKGRNLLAEAEQLERLERFAVSADAERLRTENNQASALVASRLVISGKGALKRGEYREAVDFLQMAQRLDAEIDVEAPLAEAQRGRSVVADQEREAVERAREKIYDELRGEITAALSEGNYGLALERLNSLERLDINPKGTKETQEQVQQALTAFTQRAMSEGDRRYAEGAIEQALRHWERAQKIAPSEELAGRIAKAQRFLERYRELKAPPSQEAGRPQEAAPGQENSKGA